jgi:protein-disulfide isomerase
MIKARNSAERFALRAFAAARCAKEDKGIVFHLRNTLYRTPAQTGKQNSSG